MHGKRRMTSEGMAALSRRLRTWISTAWGWVRNCDPRPAKRLKLCETLPLGEHRFLAVVEFGPSRFLVGGTSSSLVLLSHLENATEPQATPAWQARVPIPHRREETC
jgi:flagellar biogenesis protein FliO